MDVDTLTKGIGIFASAVAALKETIELLPASSKKADATAALQRAEREFKIAEAQAAKALGYHLCQCTVPPQIMLFTGKRGFFKCPQCGHELDDNPHNMSTVHNFDF